MAAYQARQHCLIRLIMPFLLSGLLLLSAFPSMSQAAFTSAITPDGTLGTTVAKTGNVYDINGGTIKGSNQFHSFGLFSVGTGDIASFNGPSSIANILSRVTGGQQSMIDGTLRSTIQGANLYLLNPAGLLFGPNASLDLSGSFHVTTADYLRFTDGARFYADLAQPTVLSVAPVAAFGFSGPNPAPISIQGSFLQVPAGQTLSVVGGDITITGGTLSAPSGRINLASVASPGEVIPSVVGQVPDLNVDTFTALGRIEISQSATIDASGDPGGTILIRGGRLMIDSSAIGAETLGDADGAPLSIDLNVQGDLLVTNGSVVRARTFGAGNAGSVGVTAQNVLLSDASSILADSVGPGRGGSIGITAQDSVHIDNSSVSAAAFGSKDAGNVRITTNRLELTNGGFVGTFTTGAGNAGSVDVMAQSVLVAGVNASGDGSQFSSGAFSGEETGNAGTVHIQAQELQIRDGGKLTTRTEGFGAGGDIQVAVDRLLLSNASSILADSAGSGRGGSIGITAQESVLVDNSSVSTSSFGSKDAGNVRITTNRLELTNGGFVGAFTTGAGNAGSVDVTAQSVLVAGVNASGDGSQFSSGAFSGEETGNAGTVHIQAQELQIRDGGKLTTRTEGFGAGGDIQVAVDRLLLSNGVIEATSVGPGRGGSVVITARDLFQSDGGSVSTAATQAQGGDITLTADQVQLTNGAVISAESSGAGNAGNIRIVAGDSFVTRNSTVTTEAIQADGGNIELQVGHLIHLIDSTLSAKVGGGSSTFGGNITVDPDFFIVQRSRIIANAFQGRGGNINMVAGVFLVSPDSIIDASSALGINGTVNIQAPVTNLSGTLAPLPQGFLQAAALLAQRCAARMGGTYSTFVVAGREGLPLEPGGLLPSPLYEAKPAGALAAAPAQEAPGAAESGLERVLVAFHEPLLPAVRGSQRIMAKGLENGCP